MTLKNHIFFKTVFLSSFIVLLLVAAVIAQPRNACAVGAPAPTSCDPEYMDALEARAMMEAQREVAQNKNLIFKPDSVLEYTCFEGFLNNLAGAGLFSEAGCCGTAGLGGGSLDAALQNAVGGAMFTYLRNNFPHSAANGFLNGRTPIQYGYTGNINGGGYACDMMQQVWNAAKCMDFFDEDNHDAFYDFNWYVSNDPRPLSLTSAWSAANNCSSPLGTPELNVAYNGQSARHVLPAENPWSDNNNANDFVPYVEDPVNSYFQLILPLGDPIPGGGTVTCATPILTGVCVNRGPSTSPYPDGVCPNPGCHYQPQGATTCASTPDSTWCAGP